MVVVEVLLAYRRELACGVVNVVDVDAGLTRLQARERDDRFREDRAARGAPSRPGAAPRLERDQVPLERGEIALDKADPAIQQALELVGRQIALFEDGDRLAPTTALARLSLPSDRSFDSYQRAVNHVTSRQDSGTGIYADQGYVDAHFTYAIASPGSRFAVRTAMALDLRDYLKLAIQRHRRAHRES